MSLIRKLFISFLVLMLFYCVSMAHVEAASNNTRLFFDTSTNTNIFNKGDEIKIGIKVDAPDQNINAVSGSFKIPSNFKFESIETTGSILDFWINEPQSVNNTVSFQGVAIKKPFQGKDGTVFFIKGIATTQGKLLFNFDSGAILAYDGVGTNILGSLQGLSLDIKDVIQVVTQPQVIKNVTQENSVLINKPKQIVKKMVIIPTISAVPIIAPVAITPIIPPFITNVSSPTDQSTSFSLTGKGMPNSLTKIQFQNIADLSFGQKLVQSFSKDRVPLADVEVKNDNNGIFSYVSPTNLIAGSYYAVPSYINLSNAESIIGSGVRIFIKDNTLNQILIIVINALLLVIPIVSLILFIFFLPWYFKRKLHFMGKEMEFEEKKIDIEERNLEENNFQRKKI